MAVRIAPRDVGDTVRDIQHRLAGLGYGVSGDKPGVFGEATERAVRKFQEERGLRVDGICGAETWGVLVEASYALGDRLIYQRSPMLRGDDVLDLQRRLNAMGFDAGRVDGIFGPNTTRGLLEFQRNAGLATDGICGPATFRALQRLSRYSEGSIAAVRERELSRNPRRLAGHRMYLAVEPGLDLLGNVVGHEIFRWGAEVLIDAAGEPESAIAIEANSYAADLFLALRLANDSAYGCDFYATKSYHSTRGFAVATRVLEELSSLHGVPTPGPRGRAYGLLRETRMPAIVCEPASNADVSTVRLLTEHLRSVGLAIARGVRRGIEEPPDDEMVERA